MNFKTLAFTLLISSFCTAQSHWQQAQQWFEKNDFKKAKSELNLFLQNNPTHFDANVLLAKSYGYLEQWEEASKKFKKIKDNYPDNADLYYYYGAPLAMQAKTGSKLKALGKLSEIESSFKKSIALNPNHTEAHWALITYYTELPAILGGSATKAKKYAANLVQISPVDGYLAYGYLYEHDKDYKNAESNYLKAHKIGNSKTTYKKLYLLYLNKLKNIDLANQIKQQFNSN